MLTKKDAHMVSSVLEHEQSMSALTVDEINNQSKPEEPEPTVKLTARQIAEQQGLLYIEPLRRLPAFGKLPEKLVSEHRNAWEYVKGIFENFIVNGEPARFWLSLYPGDSDCLWEIPCNIPVMVPRMVAKHLEEVQKYHTFGHVQKPGHLIRVDQEMDQLRVTGTHYRGKFRPIGAFA